MEPAAEREWRRQRRERLIEAARRIFAAQGYERTSMDEIASAAGAGKPTLYRYFANKDALFEAVFVDALDALDHRLAAARQAAGDPLEALRGMLGALMPLFREHIATLRGFSDEAGTADRSRRRILRQRAVDIEAQLADVLARGRRIGLFRHQDDALAARLVYGMVWSGSISSFDDAHVVEAIVGLVVRDDRDVVRLVQGAVGQPAATDQTAGGTAGTQTQDRQPGMPRGGASE